MEKVRKNRKRFMTVREAAEIFQVSEFTMREWCREGKIDAIKPPGTKSWRIPREAVAALAQAKYGE